ncbi:MAG: hypothetical protein LM564_06400 [Desulfurococcaceae archaeon]|jgi:hypothetical protein|nr:hypothetical protein [Desulfurococcaceae archaeon]
MSLPVRVTVAARVGAVTLEGGEGPLVEFLRAYRDSVQLVVDGVWGLGQVSSEKTLHRVFYSRLRGTRVKWSPDSPRGEAVKTRGKRGNPEARPKHLELFTVNCLGKLS